MKHPCGGLDSFMRTHHPLAYLQPLYVDFNALCRRPRRICQSIIACALYLQAIRGKNNLDTGCRSAAGRGPAFRIIRFSLRIFKAGSRLQLLRQDESLRPKTAETQAISVSFSVSVTFTFASSHSWRVSDTKDILSATNVHSKTVFA